MANESLLCSPLLERLANLQSVQNKCRIISSNCLSDLKGSRDNMNLNVSFDQFSLQTQNDNPSTELQPPFSEALLYKESKNISGYQSWGSCEQEEPFTEKQKQSDTWNDNLENISRENSKLFEVNCSSKDKHISKHKYLKKGQGLARFNAKKLKGFKKRDIDCNGSKKRTVSSMTSNSDKVKSLNINDSNSNVPNKELSKFEILEELIEQDSFCSSSSKVIELLDGDSSVCSTPLMKNPLSVTSQPSPISIYKTNKFCNAYEKSSRCQLVSQSPVVMQIQNGPIKASSMAHSGTDSNKIFKTVTITKNSSGILKKYEPNIITPSSSKVKFLENGVKVLEYDNSEVDLNQSVTSCSDDTDLISISDLENLACFNFRLNTFEKNLNDGSGISCSAGSVLKDKTDCRNKSQDENNTVFQYTSAENKTNSKEKKHYSTSKDILTSEPQTLEENLDIKSHKMLLLSKVYDLTKEINIFKQKNKTMETLISELKTEKKLIEDQNFNKKSERILGNNKIKKKSLKGNSAEENKEKTVSVVSGQIQSLNDKLKNLESENSILRNKVKCLEKKEKELRNKINDNGSVKEKKETRDAATNISEFDVEIPSREGIKSSIKKPFRLQCKNPEIDDILSPKTRKSVTFKEQSKDSGIKLEFEDLKMPQEIRANDNIPDSGKFNLRSPNLQECSTEVFSSTEARVNEELHSPLPPQQEVKPQSSSAVVVDSLTSISQRNDVSLDISHTCHSNKCSKDDINENTHDKRQTPLDDDFISKFSSLEATFSNKHQKYDVSNSESNGCEDVYLNNLKHRNGDEEFIYADKVVYYYAENNTTRTVYNDDGREEILFENGQREIYYKDSSYQIILPDNSSKFVYKDRSEKYVWRDGTIIRVDTNGTKSIHFPNGQREVHTNGSARRIYPDGTIKIVYSDGRQETRYRNGQIRIKDVDGNVTMYKNT